MAFRRVLCRDPRGEPILDLLSHPTLGSAVNRDWRGENTLLNRFIDARAPQRAGCKDFVKAHQSDGGMI